MKKGFQFAEEEQAGWEAHWLNVQMLCGVESWLESHPTRR